MSSVAVAVRVLQRIWLARIRLPVAVVRAYQRSLSPRLHTRCRFVPTCSHFMIDALELYGLLVGLAAGLFRLFRCNPWSRGGWDPAWAFWPAISSQKVRVRRPPRRPLSLRDLGR